ncbi:MAG: AraC family transcriptional regulator [Acutalibacteraceae bacterium]|nr:AraC family transcriptional regulator [Acutalibacteraceae bacterium]
MDKGNTSSVSFVSDMLRVNCVSIHARNISRASVYRIGKRMSCNIIYLLDDRFSCIMNNEHYKLKKGTLIVLNPEERLELFIDNNRIENKTNVLLNNSYIHFVTIDIVNDLLFDGDVVIVDFMRAFNDRKNYTVNFYTDDEFYPKSVMESCLTVLSDYIKNNMSLYHFKSIVSIMITQINLAFDRRSGYTPAKFSVDFEAYIYSFIERNYNKNITIKTISDKFGVSKDYINKLTKKYYGLSFSDTLKSIRMNNSVFMMKMTSSGLKSISYLCGYRYYSNFYKCFTEFFGETPSEKYKRIKHVSVDEP